MNKFLFFLPLVVLLTGCPGMAKDTLPKTTTITVEKYRDLPTWATDDVDIAQPTDGTVGARLISHEARGATLEYVNCRSRLLRKLDKGEKVDLHDCDVK